MPALVARLRADAAERAEAVRQLCELGPAAFPEVVKALEFEEARARQGAAEVHAFLSRAMETIEPHGKDLALALKNDDDPLVRKGVGEALRKAGPESLTWLERAFAGKYADAREAAGRAVGRVGPKAYPLLRKNLASRSFRRRSAALAGIAETGAPEFVPAVLPLLKDKDERIRAWAATALGGLASNAWELHVGL